MKALIRKDGETVRETDGIPGIDWNTGAPLTNPEWCGGPYTLVQDYVEPMDGDGHVPVGVVEDPEEVPAEEQQETVPAPPEGYILIGGQLYKKC